MNSLEKLSNTSITWAGVFKIILAIVMLYVLFMVKDVLIWFIFAVILGILFNNLIDFLEKKRIPRLASAIVLYAVIFALLSLFIYKTAPILKSELADFAVNFPTYLKKISPWFEQIGIEAFQSSETFFAVIQQGLSNMGGSVANALFSIFGGATSTLLVIAMSFFISLEGNFVEKILGVFTPDKHKESIFNLWNRSKRKVSGWFITRIIGVFFVGAATYLVLSLLHVKYAFVLAVMAGLFDLVPIIGPIVAGMIMFSVIVLNSWPQAVFVIILFVVIQQLENNLLFPILFKKFMGISPVLVLIALAIGGKLWGVAGAVLAIPLAGVLFEVLKEYLGRLKRAKEAEIAEAAAALEPARQF